MALSLSWPRAEPVPYFTTLFRPPGGVMERVPLTGVTFSRKLSNSGVGDLQGTLLLADSLGLSGRTADLLDATTPWRCAVWAETDDGGLRWGGPIVSRSYDSGSGALQIRAAEVGAYFARRVIAVGRVITGMDQTSIQQLLLQDAIAVVGGNVRVNLSDGAIASGVLRDRTYPFGQLKSLEAAQQELANVIDGFDYEWLPWYKDGVPQLLLRQGYPALNAGATVDLSYPGDATSYSFPEDGGNTTSKAWAVGQQDQATSTTPLASTTATTMLDGGYPLLETPRSYTDVSDPTTLQAHADADLAADAGLTSQVGVEVPLSWLRASGLQLGNLVRLNITDPARFPVPVSLLLRCVGYTERPDAGTAQVQVADRVLAGGRVPTPSSAANLLATLQQRVSNVETV